MGDSERRKRTSEAEVVAALASRYPAPQFAFLPQVREGTGWSATRTADAIAMSLWPSRGLEVLGFEVKLYRADWLRELKAPAKADAIFGFCDRWWIVAPPNVVERSLLPPTWGLMTFAENALEVAVEAPKLAPSPLDRVFVAAVLRRADALRSDRKDVERAVAKALKDQTDHNQFELDRLREAIKTFEARAGVPFETWDADGLGAAVKFARAGGLEGVQRQLRQAGRIAKRISQEVETHLGPANAGRDDD